MKISLEGVLPLRNIKICNNSVTKSIQYGNAKAMEHNGDSSREPKYTEKLNIC